MAYEQGETVDGLIQCHVQRMRKTVCNVGSFNPYPANV
jgi:hypothetical protein